MITTFRDWMLAIGIVVLAIIAGCLLIIVSAEGQSEAVPPLTSHPDYDEQLNYLDKQAIEAAYVTQVQKLFAVWMVDYHSKGQPGAMLKGHRNARKGFIEAMKAIEQRQ